MIVISKEGKVLEERQLLMLIVNIDRGDGSCQHLMYLWLARQVSATHYMEYTRTVQYMEILDPESIE
jgi:hypothetical protein